MVQALPYVPSFGEKLADTISQSGGHLAQGYLQKLENQQAQTSFAVLKDPNATPIQKVIAHAKLPNRLKKHSGALWAAVLAPEAEAFINQNQLKKFGIDFKTGESNPDQPEQTIEKSEDNSEGNIENPKQNDNIPSNKNSIQELSDEQLVAMSALGGASEKLASGELKRREVRIKKDEALWNYKPTQDFIKDIEEQARSASTATQVADEFINLAKSGEISPSNLRNFAASKFGDNLPFLYSPATAQAKFLEKLQAAGLKDIFPRPSEKEFFFINSAQAQLGKTDAANVAVAELQKKFAQIPIRAADFTQEVIKDNGGVPPRNLTAEVRKKMDAYRKDLVDQSASIAFEYGDKAERKKAADFLHTKGKNLPLTEDKKKEIFKLSGNDPKKALELALELGYAIPED